MSYLLRVALPDRPGALGAVATAIGAVGGDIESIVVVERTAEAAVDDILVHLPTGALADTLYTAVASTGARVESLRRWAGAIDLHRDMDLVEELAIAERASVLMVLTEFVPDVLRCAWSLLIGKEEAKAGLLAGSTAAPELDEVDVSWLPMVKARRVATDEPWLPADLRREDMQLAAAPVGGSPVALVVGRPGGPPFLDSELARLAHLCSLAAAIRGS
ncbi:MAG: amino acid-binding protein [Frankiales bacterium]|nr:amino acid-binding protein [Frankiales bacterium]